MNDNIKTLIQLMDEHPGLPVIPMVGQDIVADCTGEWVAYFGKAELKKMCIYGENDPGYLDELEWFEAIIVHIETPTVKIPDNTETINELLGD